MTAFAGSGRGMEGRVVGLSRSTGGVPKLPVARATVGLNGMEGDRQRNRKYHGGPDRALCLYSAELIEALALEGHPIAPGATGENVTLVGIDWRLVQPGTVLALGAVRVEVTAFTWPCKTIMGAFADGDFTRISEKVHPGWSRVYARVLAGGDLCVGDPCAIVASADGG